MKKLKNKKTNLNMAYNGQEIEGVTYRAIINICIDTSRYINQQTGDNMPVSISDMRNRMKLMDIMDGSKGEIELEDNIYEQIKVYVLLKGENGWVVNNKELVQFEDDYINAK